MIEYLLKVKFVADNLTGIGEPIFEQDHVLYLLEDQELITTPLWSL